MIIQIYAFTDIHDAVKAAQIGVDHIGLIAGQYDLVYGELSFRDARKIVDVVTPIARCIALTMATDVDEILRMADMVQPAVIHISTDLDAVGLKKIETLKTRLNPDIGVMKAIPVESERSIEQAQEFSQLCDILLLDTKMSNMPGVGATGMIHDWSISKRIIELVDVPVILAGGLSPLNVAESIKYTRPWGVDSNTATNISGDKVKKDLWKIKQFVDAVRNIPLE